MLSGFLDFFGISSSDVRAVTSTYNQINDLNKMLRALLGSSETKEVDPATPKPLTIPIVYGNTKLGGTFIYKSDIRITTYVDTGSFLESLFFGTKTLNQTKSYFADFAFLICDGEVDSLVSCYYGNTQVNLDGVKYRFYNGSQTQTVDPLLKSALGLKALSYRGKCYIVFENLNITDFNGNIPNFTFNVKRINKIQNTKDSIQNLVKGVVMIPGSGEFVLDTIQQTKTNTVYINNNQVITPIKTIINQNTTQSKTDALVSLDNLKNELPSVQWVAPVVSWFGNSLDASVCSVYPAVEYRYAGITNPDSWSVKGITRNSAAMISLDNNQRPNYGGTISDLAVTRYLTELKSRGYKVMFYPMLMIDTAGKPWRGKLTGGYSQIQNFFRKSNGYNNFILHYANLVKGKVDAFIIGSELIGLTKVGDGAGSFIAVDELINLASQVRAILGPSVKISYAADWSEYHHTDGGWYNMDKLWASSNIDFVGIDCYFPLTEDITYKPSVDQIKAGFTSGEGYSYYYSDNARTVKQPLSAPYAWKNIRWFLQNNHYNPNGEKTLWTPSSKKIWFTEYGFPSVDLCTNQPNVFYNPEAVDGGLPRKSNGYSDFSSQRDAIKATELFCNENSDIIENRMIWTWDARPYPQFPNLLNVWSDGSLWRYGHWINGKIGSSKLSNVLRDLCIKAGLTESEFDTTLIHDDFDGFVIDGNKSFSSILNMLALVYMFDISVENGVVKFIPVELLNQLQVDGRDILFDNNFNDSINYKQKNSSLNVNALEFSFYDSSDNLTQKTLLFKLDGKDKEIKKSISFPAFIDEGKARTIGKMLLQMFNNSNVPYSITLPMKYFGIKPLDILTFSYNNLSHAFICQSVVLKDDRITVGGYSVDSSLYNFIKSISRTQAITTNDGIPNNTISTLPKTDFCFAVVKNKASSSSYNKYSRVYFAVNSANASWTGAEVYVSYDRGMSYSKLLDFSSNEKGVFGDVISYSNNDTSNTYSVDTLSSITFQNNGVSVANVSDFASRSSTLIFGGEVVLFSKASMPSLSQFTLKYFKRGLFGTDDQILLHQSTDKVILLDQNIKYIDIANAINSTQNIRVKVITKGDVISNASFIDISI